MCSSSKKAEPWEIERYRGVVGKERLIFLSGEMKTLIYTIVDSQPDNLFVNYARRVVKLGLRLTVKLCLHALLYILNGERRS